MFSPGNLSTEELIHYLEITHDVNYLIVDFIHTFPDEVRLMWPTPRSVPKTVFFILRYYALLHSVFSHLYGLPRGLDPEQCRARFILSGVSSMLVVTASEVILYTRVYAFSERNKRLLTFLVVLFVVIHTTAYVLFFKFMQSVVFVRSPIPDSICISARVESFWLGSVFLATLASVLVVMLIMIYIAYHEYRGVSNSLLGVFYRDGILYFVSLSVLASANILVNYIAPDGYKFLFVQTEVAIHAILSTRMFLHLRVWAEEHSRLPTTFNENTR